VPWEQHPPHPPGFLVRHAQGGGAQVLAASGERTVADLIGRAYFAADGPDPAPGPVCAHCFKPMQPGPAGSVKKFCSPACRREAWGAQKQAAATD
jgi:hypothetical protein